MRNSTRWIVGFTCLMLLMGFGLGTVLAQQPAKGKISGLEIMKKARGIYQAKDQISTVTLLLREKSGGERKIVTKRYWKYYQGTDDLDSKTLFWTEFPPDSKGMGFLIWDYAVEGKSDDLWLYLPSLRQSRRMNTRDQDDAFMGSDLTFSDMGQRRLDEDEHKLLGEELYNKIPCYVVQSTSKSKSSIYSKRISWISKTGSLVLKVDYYDRKGSLLKTQDIKWQKSDKFDVWGETLVKNVQTGHSTVFTITNLKVNNGLRDDQFSERSLRRGLRK